MAIEPDTKDWTWVLDEACPDCGFDTTCVDVTDLGAALRANAAAWVVVLSGDPAHLSRRPSESVWSPLEYACHVRDVHRVFGERLRLMLDESDPLFANWDQDEAALEGDYPAQQLAAVRDELATAAASVAATYESVAGEQWERTGRRSNGSSFSVASIGRYHLHDVVHHLHDVGHDTQRATIAAYDADAAAYAAASATLPDRVADEIIWFTGAVTTAPGSGGRVIEVGSGGGRDALALEGLGLSVRRTDVSARFVELLRAAGHEADVIDPLTDDLADARTGRPYDGVWAHASLLHVARDDVPVVVRRLAEATRADGALHVALKQGDGEAWSTHGTVEAPRHFVFWQEGPLRSVLEDAGWQVDEVLHQESGDQPWLIVRGRRR
ncbi:class I SAM-dependent methyltransferase [Nocardioides jensenii]|uniref:class I SAM-dependent methyltransferase n=1 Tax=Nocardioides jensenii TaxID=1843 RepID=UPI0008359CBF|nr:class I SAM-dependent methyltransferase [Nocardioides jensenii]